MRVEQTRWAESCFLTLTYSDDHLPLVFDPESGEWIGTLVKSHPQSFIRSVRKKGCNFKYFISGEYGEKGLRPHYHAIIFGLGPGAINLFQDCWGKGFVSAYEANPRTISYTAKYCLKGSQDPEPISCKPFIPGDPEVRLTVPPFRLMSKRPAIGTTFAKNIATSLAKAHGTHGFLHDPTVHAERRIHIGNDRYPLDQTMRDAVKRHLPFNSEQSEAIFGSDFPEQSDEETEKAYVQHKKALRDRHSRTKL